jgi:hypothetical protein
MQSELVDSHYVLLDQTCHSAIGRHDSQGWPTDTDPSRGPIKVYAGRRRYVTEHPPTQEQFSGANHLRNQWRLRVSWTCRGTHGATTEKCNM